MKNKFDKFAENCRKHPFRNFAVIFLVLMILPTIIIHLIYNIPVYDIKILRARIPAGSLLSYIGTVLTFCATFMLSMTVYLSNKEQSDRIQIVENKAILVVDKSYGVVIGLSDPENIKKDDFFIKMKFKILSNASISKMIITELSIKGMSYPGAKNKKMSKSMKRRM